MDRLQIERLFDFRERAIEHVKERDEDEEEFNEKRGGEKGHFIWLIRLKSDSGYLLERWLVYG